MSTRWEGMINDVSRVWPCDILNVKTVSVRPATPDYVFHNPPGMPHLDVDRLIREYNLNFCMRLALLTAEEIGRVMWHGGAHVGLDVLMMSLGFERSRHDLLRGYRHLP